MTFQEFEIIDKKDDILEIILCACIHSLLVSRFGNEDHSVIYTNYNNLDLKKQLKIALYSVSKVKDLKTSLKNIAGLEFKNEFLNANLENESDIYVHY